MFQIKFKLVFQIKFETLISVNNINLEIKWFDFSLFKQNNNNYYNKVPIITTKKTNLKEWFNHSPS